MARALEATGASSRDFEAWAHVLTGGSEAAVSGKMTDSLGVRRRVTSAAACLQAHRTLEVEASKLGRKFGAGIYLGLVWPPE